MAQTTVFTCDICKQSKSKGDLEKINVKTDGIRINGEGYSGLGFDICRNCLKKKGFVVEVKDGEGEQAEAQNRATLEEKLCDILMDLGVIFEQ